MYGSCRAHETAGWWILLRVLICKCVQREDFPGSLRFCTGCHDSAVPRPATHPLSAGSSGEYSTLVGALVGGLLDDILLKELDTSAVYLRYIDVSGMMPCAFL
jgi:hypothetical protein